jgi:hypothetical protein
VVEQLKATQYEPTAQTFVADSALTPLRKLVLRLGTGLGTGVQRLPFQWMMSVRFTHAP